MDRAGICKIMVVINVFTKYVRLFPVRYATAEKTFQCLSQYVKEYGPIKAVLSEQGNGRQFTSSAWADRRRRHDMQVRFTSVYHPASNPAERVMQIIGDVLQLYTRENHKR